MEFKSFSQIHLIADRNEVNDGFSSGDDFLYSIIFDIGSEEAADSVFRYIFSDKNDKPFSITLQVNDNFSGSITGRWLNMLFLILSHPQYYKYNSKLIIGIFSGNTAKYSYQVLFRQLVSELAKQNFKVLFVDFNYQSTHTPTTPFFYLNDAQLSGEEFYDWYLNKLESNNSILHFFYRYTNTEEAIKIIQRKKNVENRIENETPLLFKLIQKEILFSEKKHQFELIIQDLKADLFSKNEYLDFLHGKNLNGKLDEMDILSSMKIKKFYHQEYEILPLWFKRLGHLIKVLYGRRTFRSLFNDKVKKYKN
jgi:hypothetical protein